MSPAILLAVSALVLSILFTPVLRAVAVRRRWVDQPDNHRKIHTQSCPRLGGVPVLLAFAGSFGVALLFDTGGALPATSLAARLLPAMLLVFVTGMADDFLGLTPKQKLVGQFTAAALACVAGVRITTIGSVAIDPVFGSLLTAVWLVACSNAFNLIDGLDGLAGGLALLASISVIIAGIVYNDYSLVLLGAPLAGALLGFLPFNSYPASVFLGDCGSLWLGFLLGCCTVMWSQNAAQGVAIAAPVIALSIPLLDTTLAILRRFLRGQPISVADRNHMHHRMLRRGFSQRRVVMQFYVYGGIAAAVALIVSVVDHTRGMAMIAFFGVSACVLIGRLNYEEFRHAAQWLRLDRLRSGVKFGLCIRTCQDSLWSASSAEECWQAVRNACREMGFGEIALKIGGRSFRDGADPLRARRWTVNVPLSDSDYVRLACPQELVSEQAPIAALADMLRQTLVAKTTELRTNSDRPARPSPKVRRAAATDATAALDSIPEFRAPRAC